jgi:hypothetical protein
LSEAVVTNSLRVGTTARDEKPELVLPRTTAFFTGASLLLAVVLLAILVAAVVVLVEFHWLVGDPAD